jgi:hypothetical protein
MIGGKWTIAPGEPPQSLRDPPPSSELAALTLGGAAPLALQIDYGHWLVTFAAPLAAGALATVATALYSKLKGTFKELKVTIVGTSGTTLTIDYKAGGDAEDETLESLGARLARDGSAPSDTINTALKDLQVAKTIPPGETWRITVSKAAKVNNGTTPSLAPAARTSVSPGEEQHGREHGFQAPIKSVFNQGFTNGGYE